MDTEQREKLTILIRYAYLGGVIVSERDGLSGTTLDSTHRFLVEFSRGLLNPPAVAHDVHLQNVRWFYMW